MLFGFHGHVPTLKEKQGRKNNISRELPFLDQSMILQFPCATWELLRQKWRLSNWLLEQRSPPKDPAFWKTNTLEGCNLVMMIQNDFYLNVCFSMGLVNFLGAQTTDKVPVRHLDLLRSSSICGHSTSSISFIPKPPSCAHQTSNSFIILVQKN